MPNKDDSNGFSVINEICNTQPDTSGPSKRVAWEKWLDTPQVVLNIFPRDEALPPLRYGTDVDEWESVQYAGDAKIPPGSPRIKLENEWLQITENADPIVTQWLAIGSALPRNERFFASWPTVVSYADLMEQSTRGSCYVVDATADGVEEGVSALYTWIGSEKTDTDAGSWVRVCCFVGMNQTAVPANYRKPQPKDPYQVKAFIDSYVG